ncbi:molecular chaperone [Providencia alcalifaciens]|uniref:fimbrial biogenesis chaperone n=1 Tax=Providencia alcalifaciens TaxID=126385 RepID=UPI001CC3CBBB|nr:molecular chaperone [Providencia alcalifaciens]CAG9406482.1 putative fimbrial chaperone YraI [Providencia alcalifaciens]CAG9406497.1 putative fimbrial chaperone YraI [Providencia alcalifaciens]CAG9406619.1 putative fimbrial chaperone YraI [Providencia alcalifaciens]CAG9407561.1 putative fimbrial chaperone YraI [Providencia alcalifaciens]CAG9407656.1 putative fimbrial chaperone YraI [Providencia alcalifaciens]
MNNLNLSTIKKSVLYRLMSGVALLATLFVPPVWANNIQDQINGLTLHSTRVIYPHDAKNGVTYTITNNTTIPYLLQARLLPWEGNASSQTERDNTDDNLTAFIALPPLQRFEPGETLTLRILQKHHLLTQDKESIAQLSLTAIPAQSKAAAEGAHMVLAVQNNLKLFYRPAGLPEHNFDHIAEQLQFQRTKNTLTLKNPTPFYVTLASLSVGKNDLDLSPSRMVAPFSERQWPLDASHTANDIHWRFIDDEGGNDTMRTRQLSAM